MPRFFIEPKEMSKDEIILIGENARHITKSLRMQPGESLTVCDGQGMDAETEICSVGEKVTLRVLTRMPSQSEPSVEITLYQALPKAGKMETIVQKAVELGVARIVPVLSTRCVSRPDTKAQQKKTERYYKIALEAAKQSGRGRVPTVEPMISFSQLLERIPEEDLFLLFYEGGGESMKALIKPEAKKIGLFIGPEGGLSPEEVHQATSCGAKRTTLGPRILRCETAPLAALSVLLFLTENM